MVVSKSSNRDSRSNSKGVINLVVIIIGEILVVVKVILIVKKVKGDFCKKE